MKQLELAVRGLYDVTTNGGMTYAGLHYMETLEVGRKISMLFVTPDGRIATFNVSYIASIIESEGGNISDESIPGEGTSTVRPECIPVQSYRSGDVPDSD